MCGRYYVDREMEQELLKIVMSAERNDNAAVDFYTKNAAFISAASHDICPTDTAPVLALENGLITVKAMKWGFGSPLIINARSETAADKITFAESLLSRRCAIPANGFYEWDAEHNKYTFTHDDKRTMYFAGIYKKQDGQDCFVILTTIANSSMMAVHDRMPLILEAREISDWVNDSPVFFDLMKKSLPALHSSCDYEQLSLF